MLKRATAALLIAGVALAAATGACVGWWPGQCAWLDSWTAHFRKDPALSARYDWPAGISFKAPLDLPHINNYPAFARLGARGTVMWQEGRLHVTLSEITHARERNVWFDCRDIQQVRVGLSPDGPYDERSVDKPAGHWSGWQTVNLQRPPQQPLIARNTWSFEVNTDPGQRPWAQRLAIEARCTVRDGSQFGIVRYSPAWFLARAAHAQARAPDPCMQAMRLYDAISASCVTAVAARLSSPWGRREAATSPLAEASWLDLAIAERVPQALRPLVRAGVDVNGTSGEQRETALIYAAGNGDADMVRELLMLGARKDQANAKGFTPYNAAAVGGFGDVALELAEQGVARDLNTGPAYTALSLAAYHGEIQAVRRLLESGSDPDKQINGWYNALHHAVKKDNVELARLLLAGGADPNVPVAARRGETPLMMAAENGSIEMMELLRMMDARLDAVDKLGKTAADYAMFFRQGRASDYLCRAGLDSARLDTSPQNGDAVKRASCG